MFIEEQVTNRLLNEGNERLWDKQMSENEMIAQGFVFLVATYGGTALTLAFSIYEMAVNEDIQHRLYDELTEAIDSETGEIPDDELARLPYLDAVVSETLRRYTAPVPLARYCTQDCKLGDTAGQQIEIPVHAIHHSDLNYKDPFIYDPDRFMPDQKQLIRPYTYLPFGAGPRHCV
ncbi:unnamed protein product, partial [Oppiella nova]